MDPSSSQKKPRGARLEAALSLSKRPEGVTGLEGLHSGTGIRLADCIYQLKKKGHHFREAWEVTPHGQRVKRYWWDRWEAPAKVAEA